MQSTDTLFHAASISKAVAAVAALKMVQDGKLNLDEDVNGKLASWKVPENEFTKEQKVTLRRLLSHGAGLSISGFPGYRSDTNSLPEVPQILDGREPGNTKPVRVVETPGTRWSYSGGGYMVIQLLLTDISGKPFAKLMSDTVLKKLEMKSSTFQQQRPQNLYHRAAIGHTSKGEKMAGNWHIYPGQAAAGLWTTPYELKINTASFSELYP